MPVKATQGLAGGGFSGSPGLHTVKGGAFIYPILETFRTIDFARVEIAPAALLPKADQYCARATTPLCRWSGCGGIAKAAR
jgi:hypothetical protein